MNLFSSEEIASARMPKEAAEEFMKNAERREIVDTETNLMMVFYVNSIGEVYVSHFAERVPISRTPSPTI